MEAFAAEHSRQLNYPGANAVRANKKMQATVLAVLLLTSIPCYSLAAGGLIGRMRANQPRTTSRVLRSAPPQISSPTGNRSGTSRLPSGRNYYQGRYYGNLNNRFYGPQYGYF